MAEHEKYIVLKLDDAETLKPGTFFVIRSSDMFGIAGLYAYANQIQTTLEIDKERKFLTDVELLHLRDIADYIADLARQWQVQQTKVPD